ncbi:MAG: phosphotransferase [Acidobacteria bacterium]|nr:phosphotransferase [Acidobacteriota bacterium]
MFLTPFSLFSYLRLRGIASAASIMQDGWQVSTYEGRNNLFFARAGSLQFTVKQAGSHDTRQALVREAEWYWFAQSDPRLRLMRPFLPHIYSWDPERFVFVMQTLAGSSFPQLPPHERFSANHAAKMGGIMATVHMESARSITDPDLANHFSRRLPTFLNVYQTALHSSSSTVLSDGQREFYTTLRTQPEFDLLLSRLRETWRAETLIHSDWKLANCLIDPAIANATPYIIDWELIHHGDSAWDAATLLQSYWNYWVEQPSLYPLNEIRPALAAFWSAYSTARQWNAEESTAQLTRTIAFAGARMLQSIFESTSKLDAIQPSHVRLMQASLNILKDPAAATKEFFRA